MRRFPISGVIAAVTLVVLASAAPAAAQLAGGLVIGSSGGDDGGIFDNPREVAVNPATGQVYVADRGHHRIQRFAADGSFEMAWGWDVVDGGAAEFEKCTVPEVCKAGEPDDPGTAESDGELGRLQAPSGVAVDPDDGSVYVWNMGKVRVEKFTADGDPVLTFGGAVNLTTGGDVCPTAPTDVCQPGLPGDASGQLGSVFLEAGLDVDPVTGDVVVGDPRNRRVAHYNPDGTFVRAWGWDVVPGGPEDEFEICTSSCKTGSMVLEGFNEHSPQAITVGPDRVVYAPDRARNAVQRFDSAKALASELLLSPLVEPSMNVAGIDADLGTGHLFAVAANDRVFEIDTGSGAVIGEHLPDDPFLDGSVYGLEVDSQTGHLYITGQFVVVVLTEDGAPEAEFTSALSVDAVDTHSADVSTTVVPNGPEGIPATGRFEVCKDADRTTPGIQCTIWQPRGDPEALGTGTSPVPVSQTLPDLEANASYLVRLVVTKPYSNPAVISDVVSLTTPVVKPDVVTGSAQHLSAQTAQIVGRVNPNNLPTTYWVEYGPTDSYGLIAPVPAADAGDGGLARAIVVQLTGLTADTTYHYRVVAENPQGRAEGADAVFTTREGVDPPPVKRGLEIVTPPDKNNRRQLPAWPTPVASVGTSSPDGESVLFRLDFGILDANADHGSVHVDDWTVLRRTPSGWKGEAVFNAPSATFGIGSIATLVASGSDFRTQAWQNKAYFFDTKSSLGTRVLDDTGGPLSRGWYDWLVANPSLADVSKSTSSDSALIDDESERMLRWTGEYGAVGILGPGDPSASLVCAPVLSGCEQADAIYMQEPPGSGSRHLVNLCTDGTLIPGRITGGLIGTQTCAAGVLTSPRGAVVGGGDFGLPGGGTSRGAMSTDGARVFFLSPDPAIPDAQAPCVGTGSSFKCPTQLFVRQYATSAKANDATVRWISRSEVAGQVTGLVGPTGFEGASDDGRVVYFRTNSPLTADDPNGTGSAPVTTGSASDDSWDLYRYELPGERTVDPAGGKLTRISGGPGGAFDPNVLDVSKVGGTLRYASGDGERAYFVTRELIGSTSDPWNQAPQGGKAPDPSPSGDVRYLYLYDHSLSGEEAKWKYIATLPTTGHDANSCAPLSTASGMSQTGLSKIDRTKANCIRGAMDGNALAFETAAPIGTGDGDEASDIYLYEAPSHELVRVSAPADEAFSYVCAAPDDRCNADFGFMSASGVIGDRFGLHGQQRMNLATRDGFVSVFFESRAPLVPQDVDGGRMDVYEWRGGALSLVTQRDGDFDAFYSGNSTDGEDVFFQTADRIDPREIDDDWDIYDARIGGGFPYVPPAPICDSGTDGCRGPGALERDGDRGTVDPSGGGDAEPGPRGALVVKSVTAKARRAAARSGVLRLTVRVSTPGSVKAIARARLAGRLRKVAADSARVARPGLAKLELRLSGQARRKLRQGKRVHLRVSIRKADALARTIELDLRRAGR